MPIKVKLFRFTHPDGSAKDWAYPVDTASASPAFTVFYGRAGSALRQAETPAAHCHHGSPAREAEQREREKRAKGYHPVGEFWLADNRRLQQRVTPSGVVPASPAPPAPPALPQLYWRWRPDPGWAETDPQALLESALIQVAEPLARVGWTLPGVAPATAAPGFWSGVVNSAGEVALTVENRPFIAFWLLLARACPSVRLADAQGQPVTAWPPQLPVDPAILETLGLKPQDLRQFLAATGGDWFF
jgi:hypothetical protein